MLTTFGRGPRNKKRRAGKARPFLTPFTALPSCAYGADFLQGPLRLLESERAKGLRA
jgi:hypothetical protein